MEKRLAPSSPDSPPVDLAKVRTIHVVAIAGTGMGSFAQLLKQAGYAVRGSDQAVWPPMSDVLERARIPFVEGFRAENLDPRPDLVIIGNVVRRNNPEAVAVRALGLPHLSFPEALSALFLEERHPVVVAGTHGKTTTTALLAWVLEQAGLDPSFLVGGMTLGWGSQGDLRGGEARGEEGSSLGISARLAKGRHFVIEGDEYDTAYFDKGPKLLHYRPRSAILTSVELDHADIFRDADHYESVFGRFLSLIPADGYLAVCAGDERARRLVEEHCRGRVETYSARTNLVADWVGEGRHIDGGTHFTLKYKGKKLLEADLPMAGVHNVENAVAVAAVAHGLCVPPPDIVRGLATFPGVARRQEVVGQPRGVTVIDDFAHHPTAVRETVRAMRERYAQHRLWAVFEPRSNTARRRLHQEEYARSFDGADMVLIAAPPPHPDHIPADERLDPNKLVRDIAARGPASMHLPDAEAILEHLIAAVKDGDVVLIMSNGSFGGVPRRLVEALKQ